MSLGRGRQIVPPARAVANILRGLALSLALISPLAAQDLAGQSDPAFDAAMQSWLADDEAAALPAFAALAQAGNASAQFTLALIDKTAALQGPWLALQSRATRIEVMRSPGGLSGKSWIDTAAQSIPRAALWRALWSVDTPLGVPLDFMRANEHRAAREAMVALRARERSGFDAILDDPAYPPAMRYLAWQEWDDPVRIDAALATLHPGDPQRAALGRPVPPEAREDWLLTAPEAAPIAALCSARCAATQATCATALADAIGSTAGLMIFGTPSEALVPTETFVQSPRGQGALLRRILLSVDARGRRQMQIAAQETDACAAALIEAEAERYRYVRTAPAGSPN
jgi:hypothetical protein